jgi:hypothetical protein
MGGQAMTVALGAVCLVAGALFADADINLDLFLQPWSFLEQGNGNFEIGLHRAQTALRAEEKSGAIKTAGKLRINFSESSIQEAIENAWVSLTFKPYLRFKAGKFKIPFGANNLVAAPRMPTVYNSFTTSHLKSDLYVAGYRSGAMVYGDITPIAHFSVGTFEYPLHNLPGTETSDLFRLPVARIGMQPCRGVGIDYMVAAPELARVSNNGGFSSLRLVLHDIAVTYDNLRWYRGSLEYFLGVDTTDVPEVQMLYDGYRNNVAYSIYSAHTVTLPFFRLGDLRLTTAAEFLNGLDRMYEQFVYRPFYYAFTQDIQLLLGKGVIMECSYDMRFNERLHGFKYQRIAAQIHFGASGVVKTSKRKSRLERDELED